MSTNTGQWRIQLLGGLTASQGETRLTRFATYKTDALFAYLAYFTPQVHSREVLLELFWPDAAPPAARNSLSAALSALRRQCEPNGTPAGTFVQTDRQTVRLNPAAFRTDIVAFETAAQAALAQSDAAALEAAVMLYHGPLLPDLYEDWVGAERERLGDLHLSLLNTLIQRLADSRDFERALTYAHRAVQTDPLREASHRTLMRLHAATGRPAAALEHFRLLEQSLQQTLGVAPSRATQELVREIAGKLGRPGPPPAISSPGPEPNTEIVGDLPQRLTRFFGRESDRDRLGEWLQDPQVRLVTLTGPGGIGKSRLSLEVAQDLRGAFRQRVWFIPLSDVTEAGPLRDAIRDGLRLPRTDGADPQAQIVAALAAKPSLLVLDNCEQLVAAGAPILRALLEQIPGLTCLVSSRQPLEIAGEREWPVSSLPVPSEGADCAAVTEAPAVRLFVDRMQARRADFGITPGNFETVGALCRKLEGIPLALELAADWARMLTPAQMLARLTHRFDLLVSRRPDLPARHQSLRAALDSSVTLLPQSLQRLFARLSVFRGGWTLPAAEAVCADAPAMAADCLDDLRRLQERSLIIAEEAGETMRYRMLETLREYADEQMTPEDKASAAQRHAAFFHTLAVDSRPILGGPDPAAWMDRLELERANLRTALDWALPNDAQMALNIPEALWRFWEIRGHRAEGALWLEEALRATAEDHREEIVLMRAHPLNILGLLYVGLGSFDEARVVYEESLAIFRHADDTRCIASVLNNIGVLALNLDDYAAARPVLEETLALKRNLGDERSLASTLSNLGQAAEGMGGLAEARACYRQSLDLARKFNLNWGIAHLLANLADLALQEDDLAESLSLHRQSLVISQGLGDKQSVAERLMAISSLVFRSRGPVETSVRLFAAANAFLSETGGVLRPNVQEKYEQQYATLRTILGDAAYDAQWQAGGALSLDDAVAEAHAPSATP